MPTRIARHQRQGAQQQPDIEQHADGDEEQAEQHLAVGADRGFDLMAEFGLRQHHAGEKRAERQRQTGGLGRPCGGRARRAAPRAKTVPRIVPKRWRETAGAAASGPRRAPAAAPAAATPMARDRCDAVARSPPPASADSRASNNGKLKSWNRQMATARRPCVRLFSDCSVSCEMMIAVEDIATAPPTTTATAGAMSNSAIAPTGHDRRSSARPARRRRRARPSAWRSDAAAKTPGRA